MKNKTLIKIILDVALLLVFILLMNAKVISMAFHEIAGVMVGAFFLVHKLLNWSWIKSVTHNIFGKKITAKTRLRYILDVLLLLGVYTIIISGILMSEVLFPQTGNTGFEWKSIHTSLSYACIILIGLHVGLHWKWIMNGFSRMFRLKGESKARKWLLRTAAFIFAVWGLVTTGTNGFFTKIGMVLSSTDKPSIQDIKIKDESNLQNGTTGDGTTDESTIDSSSNMEDTVSVETYLSNLTCTACHKNCSLLNPRCGKGLAQQENAISQFKAAGTTDVSNQASVWKEEGVSYLQFNSKVNAVASSTADVSVNSGVSSTDTSTATTIEEQTALTDVASGKRPQGAPAEGSGQGPRGDMPRSGASGVLGEILVYAPIIGLFTALGYIIDRLLNRKKNQKVE